MTTMESSEQIMADESAEELSEHDGAADEVPDSRKRMINWRRVLVYGLLPVLALLLALGAGFLKWQNSTARADDSARIESVQAAINSTIALLSYEPETVEEQLGAARSLLTGEFRDSYWKLANDVVIPGAKQQVISAVATVPAAAPISASESHAVVMVFVNQTTTIGSGAPSKSISSIRVTLDKVNERWLISQFEPV